MTLIINLKVSRFYGGITPESLDSIKGLLPFLNNYFKSEKISFYLNYLNEIEGETIFEKDDIKNLELNEFLSFNILRKLINAKAKDDLREYFYLLRNMNIRIDGKFYLGNEEVPAYILISNNRLSKTYGSLFLDTCSTEEFYNLYEILEGKPNSFIDELDNFIMDPNNKIKDLIKSCFVLNDNSEKDFPFNARYLYYDTPLGYVNDGFIEVYKKDKARSKHLVPIKSFLARKIAINQNFRNFLFEESKVVGLMAKAGSLSIRVIHKNALEDIYEKIKSRIDSLVKNLPDEDFFEKEIEKRFKI